MGGEQNDITEGIGKGKISHSVCLQTNFIGAAQINRARRLLESVPNGRSDQMDKTFSPGRGGPSKMNVSKSSTEKNDIAAHGVKKIYSVVIGLLHDGRAGARLCSQSSSVV